MAGASSGARRAPAADAHCCRSSRWPARRCGGWASRPPSACRISTSCSANDDPHDDSGRVGPDERARRRPLGPRGRGERARSDCRRPGADRDRRWLRRCDTRAPRVIPRSPASSGAPAARRAHAVAQPGALAGSSAAPRPARRRRPGLAGEAGAAASLPRLAPRRRAARHRRPGGEPGRPRGRDREPAGGGHRHPARAHPVEPLRALLRHDAAEPAGAGRRLRRDAARGPGLRPLDADEPDHAPRQPAGAARRSPAGPGPGLRRARCGAACDRGARALARDAERGLSLVVRGVPAEAAGGTLVAGAAPGMAEAVALGRASPVVTVKPGNRSLWRPFLAGSLVGLAMVCGAALDPLGLFEGAELKVVNAHFRLRGPVPPVAPIVIVTIDEDSFDELNLTWPWPRALHAALIDILRKAQPAVIGVDIVFAEPSPHGPVDDQALAEAVARAGNVVLGAALTTVTEERFVKEDLNPPIRPIRDGARAFGYVNFETDSDAFVRRVAL